MKEGGFEINIIHDEKSVGYPYDDDTPIGKMLETMGDFQFEILFKGYPF